MTSDNARVHGKLIRGALPKEVKFLSSHPKVLTHVSHLNARVHIPKVVGPRFGDSRRLLASHKDYDVTDPELETMARLMMALYGSYRTRDDLLREHSTYVTAYPGWLLQCSAFTKQLMENDLNDHICTTLFKSQPSNVDYTYKPDRIGGDDENGDHSGFMDDLQFGCTRRLGKLATKVNLLTDDTIQHNGHQQAIPIWEPNAEQIEELTSCLYNPLQQGTVPHVQNDAGALPITGQRFPSFTTISDMLLEAKRSSNATPNAAPQSFPSIVHVSNHWHLNKKQRYAYMILVHVLLRKHIKKSSIGSTDMHRLVPFLHRIITTHRVLSL